MMTPSEILRRIGLELDPYWTQGSRKYWILIGFGYMMGAIFLHRSKYRYPPRTWTLFYFVAVIILVFFNVSYWVDSPPLMQILELGLLLSTAALGISILVLLLSLGEEIDSGEVTVPHIRDVLPMLISATIDLAGDSHASEDERMEDQHEDADARTAANTAAAADAAANAADDAADDAAAAANAAADAADNVDDKDNDNDIDHSGKR